MNIFIIPSWYPSPQHPYTGIFFREQAQVYASINPNDNLGISLWGQNDERFLLWSKDNFKNFIKIRNKKKILSSKQNLKDNCAEYFNPEFTWTLKFKRGNITQIIKKNLENLENFESDYGKVDIILAHVGYPGGFVAYAISAERHIPYVVVEHMSPFPFKIYLNKKGELLDELNKAYHSTSRLVAVSHGLSSKMENLGFHNILALSNFIDDKNFQPSYSRSINDVLKIVVVARLTRQKGLDILLKAIKIIPDCSLIIEIIGDGEEENSLKTLSKKYRLDKKISWRGYQPKEEIIQSLQQADLFVLPSRHENLPLAFLEALACGKPCIGTYCGGPEELINKEVGLIVEKEDPEALAKAILFMSKNLDKYPPEKIRKYYDENFSSNKTVKKLRNLFEDVINH